MRKSFTKSMTTGNTNQQLSLEEITEGGKRFYFDELQGKLEKGMRLLMLSKGDTALIKTD